MADDYLSRSGRPSSRSRCSPSTDIITLAELRTSTSLSKFECIISTHPPIFQSLLLQLPTSSILDLYHTSDYLRSFLQRYPLAWNHLSFRSPSPGRLASRQASPASDSSGDSARPQSQPYALDQLLMTIIQPFGTRLISLELDHTAVAGDTLTSIVLHSRRETLQHLSVRGCKQVSLKYNIVPFLTLFSLQKANSKLSQSSRLEGLALRSLYTFRCRHHRRRPYTPASLVRKDSDSLSTHELIKICHDLGIWTDTAWCPTPGGRCFRRKDYSIGRGTPDARIEVWVAYDRLWRSGNRLGSPISPGLDGHTKAWGQLWEDAEYGFDGEPLGCESRPGQGEGKNLSTHLRQSHRKFVENIKCHGCGMGILERCEHCSIRMHCMGCRKTLCESCAFLRPLPLARSTSRPQPIKGADFDANHHWWAPGQTRNPNLMMQEVLPSTSTELSGSVPNSTVTPALRMQWCCLKPMFTNGGSIQFVGPGMSGPAIAHVRTAPLPMGQGFEDAEFMRLRHPEDIARSILDEPGPSVFSPKVRQYQMLQWLLYGPGSNDHNPCPRSLCQECWQITGWRAACQACKEPFCFAHDLRGLTMRICGYKDLTVEKANMDTNPDIKHTWEDWGKYTLSLNASRTETKKKLRAYLGDHRNLSGLSPNLRKKYLRLLEAPESEIDAYIEMNEPVLEELSGRKKSASCGSSPPHSREDMATIDAASSKEGTEGTANDVWRGCGSFLCPQFRSIGDHRPRCSAAAKQCTFCDVHVCPECLAQKPACGCSYCKDNYACPECLPSITQLCKKVEEEEKAAQREGGRIEAGEVDISDERGGANG